MLFRSLYVVSKPPTNKSITVGNLVGGFETTYDFLAIETIPTFTIVSGGGSGYTPVSSTVVNVATTGGSGTGLTVDITIDATGSIILPSTVNNPGSGYAIGEVLTITGGTATITLAGSVGNVNPNLRLIDNAFGFDDVKLTGAGATTITRTGDTGITITSTDTMGTGFIVTADTNTAATVITTADRTLSLLGGTNVTTVSDPNGTITINSTDEFTGTVKDVALTHYGDAFVVNITDSSGPDVAVAITANTGATANYYINALGNIVEFPVVPTGTVKSVACSVSGDAYTATVTDPNVDAVIAIAPQGDATEYINGAGNLTTLDDLADVTGRGSSTTTSCAFSGGLTSGVLNVSGSGANGYLYVSGNAAGNQPTNNQGMAFAYNNNTGLRENELFWNPGIVTAAENATFSFSLVNEYLDSANSNARVSDRLFKLYGNGNLELTGPTATSTIANTFWRMPKVVAPGTGYYLSKAASTIDLVWTAPPTIPQGTVTSVTAGTGMTQTGISTINPTLNVISGNGLTANADNITMSGSYTGDFTITGDAVTDEYRFRTALTTNPSTSTATLYDQSNVGATISAYRFAVRSYDGTNMLASALFTDTSLTVVGDVIAYGSPSDIRLKENIKPIESALDKVSKLQGVTFDWKKSDSILDIKEDIGFIAQDVQKVIPELVKENKDGMLSMRHQGIAPILLEAIKELKAEIEELKKCKCDCKK